MSENFCRCCAGLPMMVSLPDPVQHVAAVTLNPSLLATRAPGSCPKYTSSRNSRNKRGRCVRRTGVAGARQLSQIYIVLAGPIRLHGISSRCPGAANRRFNGLPQYVVSQQLVSGMMFENSLRIQHGTTKNYELLKDHKARGMLWMTGGKIDSRDVQCIAKDSVLPHGRLSQ